MILCRHVLNPIYGDGDFRGHAHLLPGAGAGAVRVSGRARRVEAVPGVQGRGLRGRRDELLARRLLHRDPRLGRLLLLRLLPAHASLVTLCTELEHQQLPVRVRPFLSSEPARARSMTYANSSRALALGTNLTIRSSVLRV